MSRDDDGGPAFPQLDYLSKDNVEGFNASSVGGMSLRDYFAAQALPAIIIHASNNQPASIPYYSNGAPIDRSAFTQTAYQYADAMLTERAK